MKTPTYEDIDRCVDEAFDSLIREIRRWNETFAGKPKYKGAEPGNVYKEVRFSQMWWAIDTLYCLTEKGFVIDGATLVRVQQETHSDKMYSS